MTTIAFECAVTRPAPSARNDEQLELPTWMPEARLVGERPVPVQLLDRYVTRGLKDAEVRQLEDGSWFAEVRHFPGVWATAATPEEAREQLRSAAVDWVTLKILDEDRDLPVLDNINLNVL